MVKEAEDIGLTLNPSKFEIITQDHITFDTILTLLSRAHMVDPAHAILLRSPLGDSRCISRAIAVKIAALKTVGERFVALSAHDAFILFRHSFAIAKLQYLLRTAPCYQSEALVEYDNTLRSIVGEVTNTALVSDDRAWTQAALPVKFGKLGVCSTVEVVPSAYLASLHANSTLVVAILPVIYLSSEQCFLEDVLSCWSEGHDFQPPMGVSASK